MTKLSTTIQESIEACKVKADDCKQAAFVADHLHHDNLENQSPFYIQQSNALLDAASRLEAIRELANEIVLHDRSITAIYYREKLKSLL